MQFFSSKFWCFAACAWGLSGAGAFAQTIFWGAGHADPRIDSIGRFAADSLQALGWTSQSVYCTNLNGQPASPSAWTRDSTCSTALWSISHTGAGQGTRPFALHSPSAADGVAIFDADFLDNGGAASAGVPAYNQGLAPNGYHHAVCPRWGAESALESPFIDLSAQANAPMLLEFSSRWRWMSGYATSFARVEFSADSGRTWQHTPVHLGLNPEELPDSAHIERLDLNALLAAFGGNPDYNPAFCKLRFRTAGGYYAWLLDDVRIVSKPRFDLRIAAGAGDRLEDQFSVVIPCNNLAMNESVGQPTTTEAFWGARVQMSTLGAEGLPASANAHLYVRIQSAYTDNGGYYIYTDSIPLGALPLGADTVVTKPISPIQNASVFPYFTTYYVKHDSLEGIPSNDSVQLPNASLDWPYLAKVPLEWDAANRDWELRTVDAVFPKPDSGQTITEVEYGSMFSGAVRHTFFGVYHNIRYQVFVPDNLLTEITRVYPVIRAYTFSDVQQDRLDSAGVGNRDLTLIIWGEYVDTIDVSVRNRYVVRDLPIDASFATDDIILVTITLRDSLGLHVGDSMRHVHFAVDRANYALNAHLFEASPSPMRIAQTPALGTTGTNRWNWLGMGATVLPSFNLIAMAYSGVSNTEAFGTVALYPNPADHQLNVHVQLAKPADARISVSDMQGRVLRVQTHKNLQNEVLPLVVGDLASGLYILTIRTEHGIQSLRFLKE